MIIEVKNINNKQLIELMFNDEWERHDYLKSLESLFRVHDEKMHTIYNLQNNTIIIELSKTQTKLLKDDLEWIAFSEFIAHYLNISNIIKEVNSKLKLSIIK